MGTKQPTPPPHATDLPVANKEHAAAFNEWMRLYTEQPDDFDREWETVSAYLAEVKESKEATYGETCAAFFAKLLEDVKEGDNGQ